MQAARLIAIVLCSAALLLAQSSAPASAPAGAASSQPAAADSAPTRVPPAQVIEAFNDHLKELTSLDAAAREAVGRIWKPEATNADPREQMAGVVAILSPVYKQALDAMDAGDAGRAVEIVQPATAGEDFYIAAHARTLAARALLEEDRIAEARKLLEGLYEQRDDLLRKTFLAPEVMFLLGFCRLQDVDYDGATAVFEEFEQRFPEAPDQYRLPARQMRQELTGREPEGLGDVSDLMNYAGRQLRYARANEVVQTRQARAVELLDKLIDEAEQREQEQQQQQQQQQQQNQQSQGGSGSPQGNQQPQRGADRSVAPLGEGRVGDLHASGRARPGEQWGKMRPEERERVLQALRQNYPSRYRQLVEQYYKQLSKEE